MDRTDKHSITICTSCRHFGQECRPGHELIGRLRAALDAAVAVVGERFEVEGFACLAACDRPCTVAYRATARTVWLFGDVEPGEDIDALVAFAAQHAVSADGRVRADERPGEQRGGALARVPSLVIRTDREPVQ